MSKKILSAVLTATIFLGVAQPAQAGIWSWLFGPTENELIQAKKAIDKNIKTLSDKVNKIKQETDGQFTYFDSEYYVLNKNLEKISEKIKNLRLAYQSEKNACKKIEVDFDKKLITKQIKKIENDLTKLKQAFIKNIKNENDKIEKTFCTSKINIQEIEKKLVEIEKTNLKTTKLKKQTGIQAAGLEKKEIELKIKQAKNILDTNDQEQRQRLEQAEKTFWHEGFRKKNPDVAPKFLTTSWSRQKEWRRQNAKKTAFLYSVLTGAGAWASIKYLRKPLETVLKKKNLGLLSYGMYALPIIPAIMFKKIFDWQAPSIENGQVTAQMIKNNYKGSELQNILDGPEEAAYQKMYRD